MAKYTIVDKKKHVSLVEHVEQQHQISMITMMMVSLT